MIEKKFYFMSGLPRSGSTVLSSILNQNKSLYVTPTSPMMDLLSLNETEWRQCKEVIANPYIEQLYNLSDAIINGCWEHIPQQIIIDKHRGWPRNIKTIERVFNNRPKIIITVRDIPSIVASFMTLLKASNTTYIDQIILDNNMELTDENRAHVLWYHFIHDTWDSFKTGWEYNKSFFHLVEYDNLVINPVEELDKLYDFLELPKYNHNFTHIENISTDNDLSAWGLDGLHTIRPTLNKTSLPPEQTLGLEIYTNIKNLNLEFWR